MKAYKLGDVFSVENVNKLSIKGKNYIMDKDIISENGIVPYIAAISTNNGITGYSNYPANNEGDCITLSTTADSSNTVFYQEKPFIGRQQIAGIRRKDGKAMGQYVGLYVATIIKKITGQFNYSNKLTKEYLKNCDISLPVTTKYIPDFNLMSGIIGGGISMSNIDTSSWKEFRLDELFSAESGDFDIKKEHINGLGVDVVTAGETENGILGKSDIMAKVFDGNTITIDMFGKCTYRPDCYKMVTHARVFSLKCLFDDFDEKSGLYIATMLQKLVSGFSYSNMCSWNKIKDLSIKLPVTEVEEIDWEYMQERITELEQERITELEQYLIATGLNDYELTDEDKDILATKLTGGGVLQNSISGNGCLKETAEFKISDVFDLYKGKRLTKAEHTCGNTPFIGSTDSNNGVTGYIGQEPIFSGNAITISYNGSVGQVFYQENDFWASDDINVLYLKNHVLNSLLYGYLSGALKKAGSKFSYSYKWNLERMKETLIVLPIQTDANNIPVIDQNHTYHPDGYIPDWTYMEKYIRAIEKVVIKDVVDYKDSIIAKTKEIVV